MAKEYDLNGEPYDLNNAMREILINYKDEFSIYKLRMIVDQLNYWYQMEGESRIDKWFITDDETYRRRFKALVKRRN